MGKKRKRSITGQQKKALSNIAKGMNYKQAMLSANYAPSVARNGKEALFRAENLKDYKIGGKEEIQDIINKFIEFRDKCVVKRDMSNALRANEALARIQALFTDKQQIKADITENSPFITEIDDIFKRHNTSQDRE